MPSSHEECDSGRTELLEEVRGAARMTDDMLDRFPGPGDPFGGGRVGEHLRESVSPPGMAGERPAHPAGQGPWTTL